MSQVTRIELEDRRAQQVLLVYVGGYYYAVPAPELFSRHTGVCRILGDKNQRSVEHCLQVPNNKLWTLSVICPATNRFVRVLTGWRFLANRFSGIGGIGVAPRPGREPSAM